uniref:Uncharacterized protein n=1 Tax=Rhizophora mucronata TaxID=61149 RepID=A0A2P2IQP1_RHIMU
MCTSLVGLGCLEDITAKRRQLMFCVCIKSQRRPKLSKFPTIPIIKKTVPCN